MDGKQVREVEDEIEAAIAKSLRKLEKDGVTDPLPSPRIAHLMAKAAVAVLEAAGESREGGRQRG
jgi:hypothetical protein